MVSLTRNDDASGITFTFITANQMIPYTLTSYHLCFCFLRKKVMAQLKDTCDIEDKMANKLH